MQGSDPAALAGTDPAAWVAEVVSRSGLVWVGLPGGPPPRPVWHVWRDGALWLLVAASPDGVEQHLPGLLDAPRARVVVRSRAGRGRLLACDADVAVVPPGAPEWDALLPALLERRLNSPGGTAAAAARWEAVCRLVRLEPRLPPVEAPGALPDGDLAAPTRRPVSPGP